MRYLRPGTCKWARLCFYFDYASIQQTQKRKKVQFTQTKQKLFW